MQETCLVWLPQKHICSAIRRLPQCLNPSLHKNNNGLRKIMWEEMVFGKMNCIAEYITYLAIFSLEIDLICWLTALFSSFWSYAGTEKVTLQPVHLHLWLFQHPCSHVIKIQVQHTFTIASVYHGHMIIICRVKRRFESHDHMMPCLVTMGNLLSSHAGNDVVDTSMYLSLQYHEDRWFRRRTPYACDSLNIAFSPFHINFDGISSTV